MQSTSRDPDLRVFSAGAVAPPLVDAVRMFEMEHGVKCDVVAGKPSSHLTYIATARKGDVISCGAEYILDEADDLGLTIKESRRSLGRRRSVIIVPTGNPARIKSLEDLCKENVKIGIATDGCLKGVWDDIASKAGLTDDIRNNITHHADACGSLMALINMGEVDAIFGWNAFSVIWPHSCESVELPPTLQVFRSTPVAKISFTKNDQLSQKLIDFLTSDRGRRVYAEYGWVHEGK
jgi:accessory colonization factor AcfC